MPSRPKQHQIEDKSRAAFQLTLPDQWVWRDKDKDYGIDGEVEIFDEQGYTTGLLFFVQLKATASSVRKTQRKISLNRKTISYYNRLPAPVMVVRWIEETNETFFRWAGRILTAPERTGHSNSITVQYDETHMWCEESAAVVERQLVIDRILQGHLEIPVPIILRPAPAKVGSIRGNLSVSQIRARVGLGDLPLVVRRDFARSVLEVVLTKHLILIYGGTKRLASFGGLAEIDRAVQERLGGQLVAMTIGFALFEIGQVKTAADLLRELEREVLTITSRGAAHAAVALAAGGYPDEALAIPRSLHGTDYGENVAQFVVIAMQRHLSRSRDSNASDAIESYLRENIDRLAGRGSPNRAATEHYNLGNFLRNRGRLRESLSEYRRALRGWSDYGGRAYFWEEVAGVLFLLGRFRWCAAAYQRSLALEDEPTVHGRTADGLMYAGQYADAMIEFGIYLEAVEVPADEWVLKKFFVETLVASFGINSQIRKIRQTEEKARAEADSHASWQSADEMEYLSSDALNPTGWQIMAEKANAYGDMDRRAICDLASAIVAERQSRDLWIRTLVSCFTSDSTIGAAPYIIRYAYWLFGEGFLAEVSDVLRKFVDSEEIIRFEEFIDAAIKQGETSPPDDSHGEFVVRLPDADGQWRSLGTKQ